MATVQQIPVLAARLVEHQAKFMPMSAKDAQYVIQNPADAVELFIEAVQNRPERAASRFPIWKTIALGLFETPDLLRKTLKLSRFITVNEWAGDILNKPAFTVAFLKTEIDLVRVSVSELGFPNGAHWVDVCNRAFKYDMDICPAEVGPQLRLQYLNQPLGEKLHVIMAPIEGTEHLGRVDAFRFSVEGIFDLKAYSDSGFGSEFWRPDQECIFQRPRK